MIKGFPLKVKSFQNTETYQQIWGRLSSTRGLKKKDFGRRKSQKAQTGFNPKKMGQVQQKPNLVY